jgi:putative FmdB family regulatory protein
MAIIFGQAIPREVRMPTYDYECSNGHQFEHLQSIIADPLAECITCGAPVRRLIGGGSGIIFKGSGFYVTDSKNGKPAKKDEGSGDTAAAKDGSAKGGEKSDKKPAEAAKSGGDKATKPAAAT